MAVLQNPFGGYPLDSHGIGGKETFLTVNERGSKIARNSVFDCQ